MIIEKSSDIDEKLGAAFIEIKLVEEAQEKMSLAVEQSTNSMTRCNSFKQQWMMLKLQELVMALYSRRAPRRGRRVCLYQ